MTDPVMLLSQVHAEGRVTYHALTEAGYDTLDAIAVEDVGVLAERARLSLGTAGRLRDGAREILRKGVDAFTAAHAAESPRPADPRGARIAGRTSATGIPFAAGIGRDEASVLFGPARAPVVEIPVDPPPAAGPDPGPAAAPEARAPRDGGTLREDPEYAQFLPERPREMIAAAARAAEALRPAATAPPPPAPAARTAPPATEPSASGARPHRVDPAPTAVGNAGREPDRAPGREPARKPGGEHASRGDDPPDPPERFWSFG